MKKLLSAMIVTAAISLPAHSETASSPAVSAVQEKFDALGWSEGLGLSVHKMNQVIQQDYPGTGLTVVSLKNPSGEHLFLVDKTGTLMLPLNQAQLLTGQGLLPMSGMVAKTGIADSRDTWPSHRLPDGVDKAGDLYIFTDPTCGYCTKMEQEIDDYLAAGVKVHYVPFPRSGTANTSLPGFSKWSAAMCSPESAVAYREITLGQRDVPQDIEVTAECVDAVKQGYSLGQVIGVSGTPFIYYEDTAGNFSTQGGYLPSQSMLEALGVTSS